MSLLLNCLRYTDPSDITAIFLQHHKLRRFGTITETGLVLLYHNLAKWERRQAKYACERINPLKHLFDVLKACTLTQSMLS